MDAVTRAMGHLDGRVADLERGSLVPFREFLDVLAARPDTVIRNVFQVFHDMVVSSLGQGVEEYPDDPESVGFVLYDCHDLFVAGSDHPFLADRLFANRLMRHVKAFRSGALQNKIYIFEGPPGCGKSTFLNNLLRRFQEYANTRDGARYEVVWRLSPKILAGTFTSSWIPGITRMLNADESLDAEEATVLVPCPSHDNPILLIPKNYRREFYDDLFPDGEFKDRLFNEKQYQWVFRDTPCTICSSIYDALMDVLKGPRQVYNALLARRYTFKRRLGQGITVFNPGDTPTKQTVVTNPKLQERVDDLLQDSNRVRYVYSNYAKTNNGIYALMDIKGHNTQRLIDLHNIISEGVHKVEDAEENVASLFVALMNPEDRVDIDEIQSFSDRIAYIRIPYVLDHNTEVSIYRNTFGNQIDGSFLPRVMHNFARVIISTRLSLRSEGLLEWIEDPDSYSRYCDANLQLLKMEIYTGHIPSWLSDSDRKRFTARRRRQILAEGEDEGTSGLSGRDSLKIFNEFFTTFSRDDKLISMSMVKRYFTELRSDLGGSIPEDFLDSVIRMYDNAVLGEVKESLFYFNEEKISQDIQNYLFSVNFEPGATVRSTFTGDTIEVTEELFASIENRILGGSADDQERHRFRAAAQRAYASQTLTHEMGLEGKKITETTLFAELRQRYVYNLKDKVLDPFMDNDNFRLAIRDYGTEAFKTFDKRIRDDVTFLMTNLVKHHRYSALGAREVCIYVVENDLARKF